MRKILAVIFALIVWFAVIVQFYLMMENKVASTYETVIRLLSFFTILTNFLVAIYFSSQVFRNQQNRYSFWNKPGVLTAITVYILVVGLVYQVVLRQIWEPTGMQMIVDELLHSLNPILVVVYWFLYEEKDKLHWRMLPNWLKYPFVYLVYILARGSLSDFYPYPFVNVTELGFQQVLINSFFMVLLFCFLSGLFIGIGKLSSKHKTTNRPIQPNL